MDQGWRRFLVILLAFWSNAVKLKVGASPHIQPQWGHPSRNFFSPHAAQSSVSEASVTGISPVEVGSDVLPDSSQESGSKFSPLSKYVKGGDPSGQQSMSPVQSGAISAFFAPSQKEQQAGSFTSPLQPQGFSGSSVQDLANQLTSGRRLQSQYSSTSQSSSGPQSKSASSQIVSTPEGSNRYPSYARLGSWPLSVYGLSTADQSASDRIATSWHATSSRESSSSRSAEAPSLSSQGSVSSNGLAPSAQESTFSWVSSGPVVFTQGESGSYSGLPPSQSMSSPYSPVTMYSKLGTFPLRISGQPTSDQSSHSPYKSGAPSSPGIMLATSSSPVQGGSSSLSSSTKPQCVPGQYAPVFPTKYLSAPMSSLLGVSSQSRVLSSRQNVSASQGSSNFVPQDMGSTYSGSIQSQGVSNQLDPGYLAYTKLSSSPLGVSSQSISDQTFYAPLSPASQVGSPPQGVFSESVTSQSSRRPYTSTFPVSSDTLLESTSFPLQGSSTYVDSTPQPQGAKSQFALGSPLYVPLSSRQGVSQDRKAARAYSLSQSQMAQRWQPSASRVTQGIQTPDAAVSPSSFPSPAPSLFSSLSSPGGPNKLVSTNVGSGGSRGQFPQSQSSSNQYTPGSLAYAKLGSTSLGASTQSFSDQSLYSLYGSSSTKKAGAQLATSSNFVSAQGGSGSTGGSALQSKDAYSQYTPPSPSLDVNVPVSSQYYQATPSGSRSQKWQPSASRVTQGIQNSGTAMSPSSSSTPSSTSRFPFSSAGGLGRLISMQGGTSYSGLSPSQSRSSQHTPGSLAYAKLGSTPLGVSTQSFSDQSLYSLYGSSSTKKAGAQLATSSNFVSAQGGSGSTGGSALQSKDAYSQYTPPSPSLDVNVPVSSPYYQVTPSGSVPSQKWQPSTSWPQSVPTPDAAMSPSSIPSQSSQAPSMFSSLSSPGGPNKLASTNVGSGGSRGPFPQSPSTSSPYYPAYVKLGSTPLGVSTQFSSDPSSSSLYGLGSQSKSGSQLTVFSRLMSVKGGSSSTDGPSAQLQNPSSQLASVSSLYASVPMSRQYSQLTPCVSPLSQSKMPHSLPSSASSWMQGIPTSGTDALHSSSPPQSSNPPSGFSLSALSPPVNSVTQSGKTPFSASQSLFGVVERPSRLVASYDAPLSTTNSQMSGPFALLQRPKDSILTPSLNLNAQAASMFSGPSQTLTAQTPSGIVSQSDIRQLFSKVNQPSRSSSRNYSMVKG